MVQPNPPTRLKDGALVMLSVYIDTPEETEAFPFTEEGLRQATKMLFKHWKRIMSDNDADEDYTVTMFFDDGVSTIEYVTNKQLLENESRMWRLFLSGYYK